MTRQLRGFAVCFVAIFGLCVVPVQFGCFAQEPAANGESKNSKSSTAKGQPGQSGAAKKPGTSTTLTFSQQTALERFCKSFGSAVSRGDEEVFAKLLHPKMEASRKKELRSELIENFRGQDIKCELESSIMSQFQVSNGETSLRLNLKLGFQRDLVQQTYEELCEFTLVWDGANWQLRKTNCDTIAQQVARGHRLEGAFKNLLMWTCGFGSLFIFVLIVIVFYVVSRKQQAKLQQQESDSSGGE